MVSRALSGLVFLLVMVGAILLDVYAALILFGFLTLIALDEYRVFMAKSKIWRWLVPFSVLFQIGIYFILEAQVFPKALALVFLVQPFVLSLWVLDKRKALSKWNFSAFYPLLYISLGFSAPIIIAYSFDGVYNGFLLLSIFILQWVGDTFAYLTGRTIGKKKLYPSVSPNKTIEGFAGGAFFTLLAAYLLHYFNNNFPVHHWVIIALIIVVFGTLGDLVESKLKRLVRVKDSGKIMPGHGGVLDRFDAMLLSFPFVMAYLIIFAQ
ncbi:MAG: phosphatidate cytidylyltransferase [Luteibaculaceae bacterium]